VNIKLRKALPPNRSFNQVKNHYLVEKAIAKRLKDASRQERKHIYATMYDELFSKVPDHPRLERREDEQKTIKANKKKFALISNYLDKSAIFMEFAPGDCKFAMEVARYFKFVYAVDISDQRSKNDNPPDNFKLIIYDGYSLNEIEENSIDILFSDQLIEHFHPEDTEYHFKLAHRILKEGGKYVFLTPHALSGPHDVSQYFSDKPECFHLKEWTYIELKQLLTALGYLKFNSYWCAKGIRVRMPYFYFNILEKALGLFPKRYIRFIAKYLIPSIHCVAIK